MEEHLFEYKKGQRMPNAYRWFIGQGLMSFTPWHFESELKEDSSIARQFEIETQSDRSIIIIMRRQDCDDFAGLEIIDDKVCDNVIHFHPAFDGNPDHEIIKGEYENLFEFFKEIVLNDFEEWTLTDDFENWKEDFN